jgi:pyruvate formate lyase activating enzyme
MANLFRVDGNKLECLLCPHNCKLEVGNAGICGVRKNNGNEVELMTYGVISAYSLDPIEKKPLYHFFPGNEILSVGSYGCNMRCDFCQNYSISQRVPSKLSQEKNPDMIVNEALKINNNIGIAFTYNEPVIWFEFIRDTSYIAKKENLFTVIVSNGYVNKEPMKEILTFIDAFNIDLKAFNNTFYQKLTGSGIEPVKRSLKMISEAGKHLEITTLIIPGQNDNENEMKLQTEWIAGELGKDVPLHLSRYFPMHKRNDPPTNQDSLDRLFEIAKTNLNHVYIGNTISDSGQNTVCPECGKIVTHRSGYKINISHISDNGRCAGCGNLIYKYFKLSSSKGH